MIEPKIEEDFGFPYTRSVYTVPHHGDGFTQIQRTGCVRRQRGRGTWVVPNPSE